MTTVFFSYSHKDEQLRDDLEVQLTMLKREGLIEAWHDRRIIAGSELDEAISQKLDEAEVILLLASPDFLASEYCWGTEVTRAMQRHAAGEALVIPVILRPCEWTRAPFGKLLAAPTDGKAVTGWADRDAAFLDVTRRIRAAIEERARRAASSRGDGRTQADRQEKQAIATAIAARAPQVRSSNLAVKKRFTQADEDDFLVRAFGFIAEFFEGSLAALDDRNPDIETRFRRIDANRFTSVAYRDGRKEAACTIWMGGESFGHGINYVANDSGATNTLNESLTVEKSDHGLYLKSLMGGLAGKGERDAKLSVEQAAEHLWDSFIEPLQRR
jgi:hypothetical protein